VVMIVLVVALIATVVLLILFAKAGAKKTGYSDDWDIDLGTALKGGWFWLILIILMWSSTFCVHTVDPGYRGVTIVMGRIQPNIMGEGLNFKYPWVNVVEMSVMLEVEEVQESTASKDLQEVTTILAVHFNVAPDMANVVYQNMRKQYHSLLLKPVIQEDLKATTAKFTAEELITKRPLVVLTLEDKLRESLTPYGINVQTVNIVDFFFSDAFAKAIEAKVTAEQEALREKNVLERIKWEQAQANAKQEAEAYRQVVKAQADANQTVINAQAEARAVLLEAQAEAQRILLEAEAQAQAIEMVASQLSPVYVDYQYLLEWNGELPRIMTGDSGILLEISEDDG